MKYTQEPWLWDYSPEGIDILASNSNGDPILVAEIIERSSNKERNANNAQRIVDCFNACVGINNIAVP